MCMCRIATYSVVDVVPNRVIAELNTPSQHPIGHGVHKVYSKISLREN